jgi:hypothetical protein
VNPSLVAAFEAVNLSGFQRAYCIRARAINRSTYRPYRYVQAYPSGKYLNSFLAKWVESIDTIVERYPIKKAASRGFLTIYIFG